MRNPFRSRTTQPPASTTYRVGDVLYDRRSAELLGGIDAPSRWQQWSGAMRRMFAASNGHEEQRAITSVPWVPFNQGNLIYPLGGGASAEDQALSLTPVYAAVQTISDDVSTLPVKTYRKAGDQRIPMASLPQLFAQLDDTGKLVDWLHRCVTSLLLRGNAYGLITSRDGMAFPTAIMWLDPSDVFCDESNPAAPVWYFKGRHIPSENLIHIPWFTLAGRVLGLSPIEAFALTMNVGLQAQGYTAGWFAAGGIPPGTFKNTAKTVNPQEAAIIRTRLVATIKNREPLVYGSDWDYNPITIPPEHAQFVQTMKLTATQIAAIYRIPPEMIGGETGGSLTYNTVEQNMTYYVAHTLRPWLVRLESAFSAILPMRQYVKFNADALVRADQTTRYNSYKIASEIGLLTLDEMRALEDRPPLPPDQRPQPMGIPQAGNGSPPPQAMRFAEVIDGQWDQRAIEPVSMTAEQELIRRRYEPDELGIDDPDEMVAALLLALAELELDVDDSMRAWDPAKHPRNPPGSPGGGKFRSLVDRIKDAVDVHLKGGGRGDPFPDFDREQLRRVAKARGINLKRGASKDEIAKALLDDLGVDGKALKPPQQPEVPKKPRAPRRPSVKVEPKPDTGYAAGEDISGTTDYSQIPLRFDGSHGDMGLLAIWKQQGFDGKPRVVSRAEFDDAARTGAVRETWRGITRGAGNADQFAEQFRFGDVYAGQGIYGNGTYVALTESKAWMYSGQDGAILRIGIRRDAKVISAADLEARMLAAQGAESAAATRRLDQLDRQMVRAYDRAKTAEERIAVIEKYKRLKEEAAGHDLLVRQDPGRFASLLGYDAIDVPAGWSGSKDQVDQIVILNRTAVIVERG